MERMERKPDKFCKTAQFPHFTVEQLDLHRTHSRIGGRDRSLDILRLIQLF